MREKLANFKKSAYLPLLVFGFVMTVFHIMMYENEILDAKRYFATILEDYSLVEFLQMRYSTWSSRLIIEGVLVYTAQNTVIWKILDILVWLLLAWSLGKILNITKDAEKMWFLVGCLLLYPIGDMSSAGWIATMANYLWPLSFGAYALTVPARIYREEKIYLFEYPFLLLALLYAANMEQMSAILFVLTFFSVVYFIIRRKKVYWFLALEWILSAASMVFILTCPGNSARSDEEIITGFSDFKMYTKLDKILLGFTDTIEKYMSYNFVLMVMAILLFALISIKYQKVVYSIVALIPVFYAMRIGDVGSFAQNYLNVLNSDSMKLSGSNFILPANYVVPIYQGILLTVLFVEIAILADSYTEWIFGSVVLGMGFASRMVLGFSPSIYSSAARTLIYLHFSLLFLGLYFLVKNYGILEQHEKIKKVVSTLFGMAVVIAVLNSMGYIASWT